MLIGGAHRENYVLCKQNQNFNAFQLVCVTSILYTKRIEYMHKQ